MAIQLGTTIPRHERRLRLVFSGALAAGAYSASLYALESLDALGGAPTVSGVVAVAGATNQLELALGVALVAGGLYRLTCTAVPGADASTFTGTHDFRTSGSEGAALADVESAGDDAGLVLFGRDLAWTGADFLETDDGDLAAVEGIESFRRDIERRAFASGLPYAADYGADPRSFVDGPAQGASTLRAALVAQAMADDRTKSARATSSEVANDPAAIVFDLSVTPIALASAISVKVPVGGA